MLDILTLFPDINIFIAALIIKEYLENKLINETDFDKNPFIKNFEN